MIGAGKYDDLCSHVREQSKAAAAIVIVIDGEKGHGFSVQSDAVTVMYLPRMLEMLAQQLRDDMTAKGTVQ